MISNREIFGQDPFVKRILPPVKPKPGVKYVPSQYAFRFDYDGKHYVSNMLTKQCLEAELPESALAGEGYDELIEDMFLVPEDKDECAFYMSVAAVVRAYQKKEGVQAFTIMPTLGCNARCIYCYEEGMKQVTMTPEIVEQTIRFILKNRRSDKIHLAWFGGEPLLCPDMIDRICEGVREAGVDYHSTMISNGSLITPEIVEKMAGDWRLKRVQISMDGAEEDYIPRKNYYSYHDYYHVVMEGISRLSEAGITVSIRCNIDEKMLDRIPQYIEDLKNGISDKGHVRLYFSPLHGDRMTDRDLPLWKKTLTFAPLIREAGFHSVYHDRSVLRLRVLHCMADTGNVCIAPDGNLFPCEHCPPYSRFGDIWNGVTDQAALDEFIRTDIVLDKCRKCPFLPLCTTFNSCPIQDWDCRGTVDLLTREYLKELMDHRKEQEAAEAETKSDASAFC